MVGLNGNGSEFLVMTHQTKIGIVLVFVVIVLSSIIGVFIWCRSLYNRELEAAKPYTSYARFTFIADGCDRYKATYGTWPVSSSDMLAVMPELKPKATDAWNRVFVLVPYNQSLGYGKIISYGRDGRLGGVGPDRDIELRFPYESNITWNTQEGSALPQPHLPPP
jgi:hypothetical protein